MKKLLFAALLFIPFALSAQEVPLNPEVLYGRLNNGLTYYIQKNTLPKERAMFYLVVNAGAIDEDENQNGLAHFCEHMSFNGTNNMPDKAIINYMEKNGVSFGRGINAFTSTNITCYNLNDVPTMREALIDSSLFILKEWSSNVTFSTKEINSERGVIHEEWRTYGGASRRMGDITDKVLYNNSKYAYHNVIGSLDVIDNFEPDLVRKFYKDFYRPDLQAVIVVGDIDTKAVKAKIEKLFNTIPKKENPVPIAKIIVPDNKELAMGFATDKEAQNISITMYIKHPGTEVKDVNYLKNRMLSSLYNTMLSDRFSELLQKENPPMNSAFAGYRNFTEFQDAYFISVNALSTDPLRSLKAAMIENERVKRFGFTGTELERVKKRILVSYEKAVLEKDKQMSASLVNRYMSHFNQGTPNPAAEYSLELAKSFLPGVTVSQINELAQKWMTDENRVIIVEGPEKEGVKIPKEAEIKQVLAEVKEMKIEPYQDKAIASTLISKELKGSKVVKEEKLAAFGGTKFTLANGIKVYFKPTDNKADEIMMQAFSNGGNSVVATEDLPSAYFASAVNNICGVGDFSNQDLKKFLAGKVVNVSTSLSELEESLSGSSSVADFETMLQLTYLNFTGQRHDDAAFKSSLERTRAMVENRKTDPNAAFSDTLQMLMSNYSPRINLVNTAFFDKVKMDKAYAISADRFKDASDFTFVFVGNVDAAKVKPLIEKYLGSIPDIDRKESWIDRNLNPKDGRTTKEIKVEMKDPKSIVFVDYFGQIPYTPETAEYLSAIQYILRMRFVESIREKEGGTYGVSVSSSLNTRPKENYRIIMNFTCAPQKADYLKGLLYEEIEKLKTAGVTDVEVSKTKENFLKEASEKPKNNSYVMERMKNFVLTGIYTPVPKYTTDIYNKLDGAKIQKLAQQVFKDNVVDFVMKPNASSASTTATPSKTESAEEKGPMVILDGVQVSMEKVKSMSKDSFEAMSFMKPEEAIAKYGDKAKNGVIVLTSKAK